MTAGPDEFRGPRPHQILGFCPWTSPGLLPVVVNAPPGAVSGTLSQLYARLGPASYHAREAAARPTAAGVPRDQLGAPADDLLAKQYVYVWVDGAYFTPRLERDRQRTLVLIGADASGKKELPAIQRLLP